MQFFNFRDRMPGSYSFFAIGDLHLGNSSFKQKLFLRSLKDIKSLKHSFIGLGGDLCDTISPHDKRFDIDSVDPTKVRLSKQRDAVIDLLMPVADRTLYALQGNHEYTVMDVCNFAEEVVQGLGVMYRFPGEKKDLPAYGTYTSKIEFGAFRCFDWHGWGSCISRAGDLHQREVNEQIWVKRKLRDLAGECDVNIIHHIHRVRIHPPTSRLVITNDINGKLKGHYTQPMRIPLDDKGNYYINEDDRWYASSGSYLGGIAEGFSPYSERFGYPPTDLGCIQVVVKNDKLVEVKKFIAKE